MRREGLVKGSSKGILVRSELDKETSFAWEVEFSKLLTFIL